ncbi:DMT family transporter [Anaeromicrobium sediminis]|uniref:DMT family transporter n=1 Tax=Anaeromicrobium sediminis TaxID=1478221 RepID=UPI001FA93BD6
MAATVKSLANIPVVEKIFFRNLLGIFIASYMLLKKKQSILGNNKRFLILRSGLGLMGIACYFYALSKIPLADAVILNKISPFFVVVISAIFLGEKIRKVQSIALMLSILGAGFVIKPEFNISMLPSIIALLSAFFAGSAYTIIRHLRHTDLPETIILYVSFISTVSMLPFLVLGQFTIPISTEILGLLGLSIFATSAQFLMTHAYRYAPAGELAIYSYSNIIFSTIIGFIIRSEIPDVLSIVGGGLIFIGGFINYYSNKRNESQ